MYDYIIIGAGSAGCVLANRLSADGKKRVALLEAGPRDKSPLIHMPIGIALLANNKKLNWAFETEPQDQLNNRRLFWPRGKTLGGSSSINAMIYIRGHPDDYQYWQEAAGSALWGWDRASELFRRMEDNERHPAGDFHGQGGELSVGDLRTLNPLSDDFVEAGRELQFPVNPDFNADSQEGLGYYQVTQRNGRRWSSAQAFLRQVEERANLHIITDARAERVLMNGKSTVGVAYRQARESKKLKLNPGGEVLLSGGTVNSPQLLLLSGIGDSAVLRHNGIPIVHDLPEVGQNMADHLDVTIMNAANSRKPIGVAASFIPRALGGLWSYIFSRRGFLTSNVAEAGGFVRSSPDRDRPNVQFHFLPAYLKDHGRKLAFGYGYTLHICDLLPKSRGYISLKSSDPMADPLIQPGYLADPDDLKTMIAAFKIGRRILDAPTMAAHRAAEVHPGPSVQTDDEIAAFIRNTAETIYHPTGTCRMGADAESVVDASLRVRGISGLRVVDASIMPSLVAGNTNAATMMIAENAADIILGKIGMLDANAA